MKATAAIVAYQKPKARPNESPASGAAKTSRFFGHCLGRVLCTTAFSHRSDPDRRAGAPRSGSVSLAAGMGAVIGEPSSGRPSCSVWRSAAVICPPGRYDRPAGGGARTLSSPEDRRKVSVGDVVVPVRWLELTTQQVNWRGVAWMIFGQIVHEGHPVRIDIQLHRRDATRALEQFRQVTHVQRGAVDVDDPAVRGDADA